MHLESLEPPIFVVGNPRSGTTLLRLMLTCHANIVVPPECGFAVWLYDRYQDWDVADGDTLLGRFVADLEQCRKIETWHLEPEALLAFLRRRRPGAYADCVSLVYEWYGRAQRRSFRRWGDKNNFYLDHVPILHGMFPDARFVHIVRDGRDVACSYRQLATARLRSRYAPRLPTKIEDIAREWTKNIETVRASFAAFAWKNVHEIRLEDLVTDPEARLRELCDFLDEPYDPGMLDYPSRNRELELEPAEFLQWKADTVRPPSRSRQGLYKTQLGEDEVRRFEEIAHDQLKTYGFELH